METPLPVNDLSIRHARPQDLPMLGDIERSAAELFRTVNLNWIAESEPMSLNTLQARQTSNHVWVVVSSGRSDQPIGFAVVEPKDHRFYLSELSVHQKWQRRGIGMKLLAAIETQAKEEGFTSVSLTTYRDLAWNGPFYAKAGFQEVDLSVAGVEHTKEIEEQGAHGHDVNRRCAMIKELE